MAGKGSAPRKDPTGSAKKKYEDNWDRIFAKKEKGELTKLPEDKIFYENGINFSSKK